MVTITSVIRQKIILKNGNTSIQRTIPNHEEILYSSIKWGKIESIFTPAFWFSQVLMHKTKQDEFIYKIGNNLGFKGYLEEFKSLVKENFK